MGEYLRTTNERLLRKDAWLDGKLISKCDIQDMKRNLTKLYNFSHLNALAKNESPVNNQFDQVILSKLSFGNRL